MENYGLMQEAERKRNQEKLEDRSETLKLAKHPDPYLLNQNRYHNFFQKTNKLQGLRNNLYKSEVLTRINKQQKQYDDMINKSVSDMNRKNSQTAQMFQNQRRKNLADHYNFVKY